MPSSPPVSSATRLRRHRLDQRQRFGDEFGDQDRLRIELISPVSSASGRHVVDEGEQVLACRADQRQACLVAVGSNRRSASIA
jgi:hypothetical protein